MGLFVPPHLLGVSPAAFVGRKNPSKIASSQVLCSLREQIWAGTKFRPKSARANRYWLIPTKPEGELYCRFLGFGNGSLKALYDRSEGFFRRQIILTTKRKDKNRVDDPFLSEKLIAEKEGIFLWCLEGLKRLIAQDYKFTISPQTEENMKEAVFEGNHILEFLASEGYIRLKADLTVTTKDLYAVYCLWCEDNAIKPYAQNTMSHYLKEYGDAYNIVDTNNLQNERGVRVRGFEGIGIVIRPDAPHAKIYDVE